MFRETYELLRHAGVEHGPTRNALVESLAIHGRALIEFFYLEDHKNHWNLRDLGLKPIGHSNLPDALEQWQDATNEYVAHLTEGRVKELAAKLPARATREALEKCVEWVKTEMAAALPADWIGDRLTPLLGPDDPSDWSPFGGTGYAGSSSQP